MVSDENNFNEVYEAVHITLDEGMEAIHELTLAQVLSNWSSGQDALGNPWEPLADSTVAQKGSADILTDSGELKADVADQSYYDDDSYSSVIQSGLSRAAYHEFGAPEQGLPARPIFGPAAAYAASLIPDEIEDRFDDELNDIEV